MPRPRVLLDCDGVLADFLSAALKVIHQVTGKMHSPMAVLEWDIMEALKVPPDQARLVYAHMRTAGFCASLPVYHGAQEAVTRLKGVADVYVVTSPFGGAHWTDEREQWLQRHFGFNKSEIVHTAAKHICTGDVFVDDRPVSLKAWQVCNPEGVAVRWDHLYNVKEDWTGLGTASWAELNGIVLGVAAMLRRKG